MSHAAERQAELTAVKAELTARLEEKDRLREEQLARLEQAGADRQASEQKLEELRARKEALQTGAARLEEEITAARAEEERLQEQDTALQQELAALFALAFGKKKEVRARIEENAGALSKAREQRKALEGRRAPEKLEEASGLLEQAEQELPLLREREEELQAGLRQLEEEKAPDVRELARTEAELAELEQAERERLALAEEQALRAEECAARHPEWPEIETDSLRERRNRAMLKLETLYPEHRVFALAAMNDELRESLVKLARACGYENTDALLKAHGFERITGARVQELRPTVQYGPGEEPEVVRGKLEGILRRLEEYYPDHKIGEGLEGAHKALAGDISGMSQWLGYSGRKQFLEAYGYDYDNSRTGGRPAVELRPVLEALLREYSTREEKPGTLAALTREHPELSAQLKTLSNRSRAMFGETLAVHLRRLGILADSK